MTHKNEKITAPWTQKEVNALNHFQAIDLMHPFTCPNHDSETLLVATVDGWVCSKDCGYHQNWAWQVMTEFPTNLDNLIDIATSKKP